MIDPDGFRARLPDEVAAWRRDGLVSEATARRLLERYSLPVPAELARQGSRRSGGIIAGLGATLVGLGVLLFVASNWVGIDRPFRLAILLVTLAAAYGLADRLRGRMRRTSAALTALGTVIYLASVFLVGQTYHLATSDPLIPILGALGALPLAFVASSRPAFAIGWLAIDTAWGMQLSRWQAYMDAPVLVVWLLLWSMAGVAASVLMARARSTASFAPWLTVLSGIPLVATISALSFSGMWESFGLAPTKEVLELRVGVSVVGVVLLALLVGLVLTSPLSRRAAAAFAAAGAAVVAIPSALILFHPFREPVPYAIVMNALILAAVLASIWYGVRTTQERFINVGLALFAIVAFCRYVDVAFLLFDRSLVFVGAGVVLLGLGWALERGRRTLLTRAAENASAA